MGDEQIVVAVHGHCCRKAQWSARSRSSIAGVAGVAPATVAGHSGDNAVARDLSDAMIPEIGDEQVSFPVHRNTTRVVQLGARGRSAVTGITDSGVSGHTG